MTNIKLKKAKIKRQYRFWLLEAKGLTEASIEKKFRAIALYESFNDDEDFALFNRERAMKFKENLRKRKHSGKPISGNSIRTYLIHLRSFFEWLCTQTGYKKIPTDSLEYLKVSKKESRIAAQILKREFPKIEYVLKLVKSIKINSEVDKRDQALISFIFLTGVRDSALASLPMGCIDEDRLSVNQNPRLGVKTKFSKTIPSKIFKFDDYLLEIVVDWIKHLKSKGFSISDPVFPRSKSELIKEGYSFKKATKIEPFFWKTTNSIRKILKERAEEAELPYYPPHTFRHSAIYYAWKYAKNGEEMKAISQNFGHEDISTTLSVYANYSYDDLINVLDKMEYSNHEVMTNEVAIKMVKELFINNGLALK